MQNSINSDLIRGHIDTIILSILYVNDRYGYEILGEIEEKSSGHYKIKQPTLYSCLKRLESQGFIYSYRGDETESGGGRRKYYALTEMGKELFHKNQVDWEYSRSVIDKLVSDRPFQFAAPISDQLKSSQYDAEYDAENEKINAAEEINNSLMSFDAHNNAKQHDDENIDEYFTGTDSASYIDKVVGNSEIFPEERASFQIHNFEDGKSDADRDIPRPDFLDDDEYQRHTAYNNSLLSEALEREYLEESQTSVSGEESVTVNDVNSLDVNDERAGLFKSYSVDISEVEEYNHGIRQKKSGKSLLDQLEEEARTRKEKALAQQPVQESVQSEQPKATAFESESDIVINREYKNIIKQLLAGNDSFSGMFPASSYAAAQAATNNTGAESAAEPPAYKQWREQANFDKVSDSVRSMGDDIKIRTYNSEADKEYTNLYYYYPNKLMLYQYGALFILMILEIFVPFLIIKFGAGINSSADIPILIISSLIAAAFPTCAIIANFRNQNKRKRYNLDFKSSFVFRIILLALALVIIFLANVVFKMDVANPLQYLTSLIIPGLLSTNILISLLLFKSLYSTEKFNTD